MPDRRSGVERRSNWNKAIETRNRLVMMRLELLADLDHTLADMTNEVRDRKHVTDDRVRFWRDELAATVRKYRECLVR